MTIDSCTVFNLFYILLRLSPVLCFVHFEYNLVCEKNVVVSIDLTFPNEE